MKLEEIDKRLVELRFEWIKASFDRRKTILEEARMLKFERFLIKNKSRNDKQAGT